MKDGAVVDVVLLHNVGGGAVDEGGEERRGVLARDEDLAGSILRSHQLGKVLEDLHRLRVLSRQSRGYPVEEELLGALDYLIGQVLKAEAREERGERLG